MPSEVSFNLHAFQNEYLENKTGHQKSDFIFMVYFQMIFD